MAFNLINFKKGTLAGLETLKTNSGVQEGTFYLTIDDQKQTSRLFIGTSTTTALPVNSNISIVQETSDLEAAGAATPFNDGDFAYVSNGNILAVKIGSTWHQINAPDSRAVKSLTPEISTTSGVATISWKLRDQDGNIIPEADSTNPANVVAQSVPDITIQGANGITVSSADDDLTITGTSYEMGSAAVTGSANTATIKLQSKANATANAVDVSSVAIKGGDKVTISGNANEIVVTAEDTELTGVTGAAAASGTGFTITVSDSAGNTPSGSIDPKITLGTHTAAADQIGFTSGVANLPVYTKDEIDAMNRALDALTYVGTVGSGGSKAQQISQLTNLHVGDTCKLVGDSTTTYSVPLADGTTATAHGGDLIIANSTGDPKEGTDGTIASTDLFFDIIPSGDEKIEFKGLGANHTGNGVQVEDGNTNVLASLEVAAGTQMAVSSTHTGTNGEKAVVTVNHATISSSTTGDANVIAANAEADRELNANSELTFNVVTGLTTNNGHVTGTTVEKIKVVDTVSEIDASNTVISVSTTQNTANKPENGGVSTVTETIALKDANGNAVGNDKNLAFSLGSDNLAITNTGNAIKLNLVWGSF